MVKSMTLDFAEFKALLHDFEDLVSDKHYDKMDYRMWRKVSTVLRPIDLKVYIEWDNRAVDIIFGEESEWHHFVFGDNSFGDFMFENLLKNSSYDEDYFSLAEIESENIERLRDTLVTVMPASGFGISSAIDTAEFELLPGKIIQAVADKNDNNNDEKEKTMKGFNFDFGPMNANVVRMSIYGLAVKNKTGSWVSYDAKNEEIMDVDVFNFDGSKFMYRMPVAIDDVTTGDVIVHMSVPMFVVGKSEDGKAVYAVDPVCGERKEIMLTKSPFGFNFVTKVVNFLGNTFNADASNPFGNLGLMMMLSEDSKGMSEMLPFMLMANGGNANGFDLSNPMVMYMLCKDGNGDLPMMLALSGAFNKPAAPHVCNCGQHNQ